MVRCIIWALPGRKLRKNTAKVISFIEETLPSIERQWHQAKGLGLAKYSMLYNGMSFLLLMHYDFSVLALNHATEVDDQKKNLYARQLCLLLHEALDDLPQVFGSTFRNSLHALPNGSQYEDEVLQTLRTLTVFRKANQAYLADIRHFVAAHRDHNALKQLEIMRTIENNRLMDMSGQLVEFLGKMEGLLAPVLLAMGNPKVILENIVNAANPPIERTATDRLVSDTHVKN